jgi:hypothetical protein
MRSHGVVNFPGDPAPPAIRALKVGGAMSSLQFQAAAQACEKTLLSVGARALRRANCQQGPV